MRHLSLVPFGVSGRLLWAGAGFATAVVIAACGLGTSGLDASEGDGGTPSIDGTTRDAQGGGDDATSSTNDALAGDDVASSDADGDDGATEDMGDAGDDGDGGEDAGDAGVDTGAGEDSATDASEAGAPCSGNAMSCGPAGACVDCTGSMLGHQCMGQACGCNVPGDCAPGSTCGGNHQCVQTCVNSGQCPKPMSCSAGTCGTTCGGAGPFCNGGCCSSGMCLDCSSATTGTACVFVGGAATYACGCRGDGDCLAGTCSIGQCK